MGNPSQPAQERIEGVLDRLLFRNEENGYGVGRLRVKGRKEPVSITGNLAAVNLGETLRLSGSWNVHPRFGMQFKVEAMEVVPPGTKVGIIKYLSSGRIKGIGPVLAEALVERFGQDTLKVIDEKPEKLLEVPGIGPSRLKEIERAFAEEKGIREIMIFLQGYGLGASHSAKIYRHYGPDAVSLVKENPYRLSEEIFGIGFKTADRIALNLGVEPTSPFRIRATLSYLLDQASNEGHLCLPQGLLVERSGEYLGVDRVLVEDQVQGLCADGRLVMEERITPLHAEGEGSVPLIFLHHHHEAEAAVHAYLRRLKLHAKWSVPIDIQRALEWAENEANLALETSQREAVAMALKEPVLVITGGPGVGKTTIVRCIAQILSKKSYKLSLAAPTGRAAKRLSEATGFPASTLHRLLGFNPHTFRFDHDETHPLPADVVIVDESSMIDVPLMDKLVRAVRPVARLILVGDVDQLPSVGPGEVLRCLIDCGKFKVKRLTKLFRQAEGGGIPQAAHEVNAGRIPRFTPKGEEGETFFMDQPDPKEVAQEVITLVRDRIPDRFGLDPFTDIQVITPMHKGAAGTENLNRLLQAALNPEGHEILRFGKTFRVGDKIMQTRNNYTLNVFNGDIGFIQTIDPEERKVKVRIDDRVVSYPFDVLDELSHAYCISVHKSQGSEFRAVVMPLLTQHFILLRRNLLYTGITRAKELLVVMGSKKAVRIAVANNQTGLRYSRLDERLKMDEML